MSKLIILERMDSLEEIKRAFLGMSEGSGFLLVERGLKITCLLEEKTFRFSDGLRASPVRYEHQEGLDWIEAKFNDGFQVESFRPGKAVVI